MNILRGSKIASSHYRKRYSSEENKESEVKLIVIYVVSHRLSKIQFGTMLSLLNLDFKVSSNENLVCASIPNTSCAHNVGDSHKIYHIEYIEYISFVFMNCVCFWERGLPSNLEFLLDMVFIFSQQQHKTRGVRGASPKFAVVMLQIETAVRHNPHFKITKKKELPG